MLFIDTHCHLYLSEFKTDLDKVIENANNASVKKFYMPSIDSTVINELIATENNYAGKCFAMMGLHPCSVKENYKDELAVAESWLAKRTFAAVGEIGLDFYWDATFIKQQYEAFEIQMQWALNKN